MQKIWLQSYPSGVPAEIDLGKLRSLVQLLREACTHFAHRPAFEQFGRSISFTELDELSLAFAAWLQAAGFVKGDRLAIMLPNSLQYPVALFGALRAGLTVVNVNPLYTARELRHQLKDSGATVIVVLENFAHVVEQVAEHTDLKKVLVTAVGDLLGLPKGWIANYVVRHRRKQVPRWRIPGAVRFRHALRKGRRLQLSPVEVGSEDIAFLQYTGGTTGVSKGAMLTHGNVSANVLQGKTWLAEKISSQAEVLITAIPLYHIFALTSNCLCFVHLGWKNVLIMNARDFPALVAEMKKHPFAYFSGVNTLFNALLHTPGFRDIDFSHLKVTIGGGMAVQASVAKQWKAVTGSLLTQGWGLSETSPTATINPTAEDFNGSIGLPIPSTDIAIKDDQGVDVPLGQTGEICVRGPQVMRGYWNRPEETAKAILPGGWLRTGDVGYMDPRGYIYLQDRKKDLILVSGFNVYPNEVEEIASSHPGVLEAAAVAQSDERSGEVVALYVVAKHPGLTEREIIEHCRKSLAAYKVPRYVYFRRELPKSNVGKILRRELKTASTVGPNIPSGGAVW